MRTLCVALVKLASSQEIFGNDFVPTNNQMFSRTFISPLILFRKIKKVAEKTFEYAPDAIVANFRIPVVDAVSFYNDFVHGLPFGLSESVQTVSVENINSVFDGLDSALYAVSGSFTEIRSLAELTNLDVPINNFLMNAYC